MSEGRSRLEGLLSAGLSQADIAGACGVSRQTVHRWVTGEREVSALAANLLAVLADTVEAWRARQWSAHSLRQALREGGLVEAQQHLH